MPSFVDFTGRRFGRLVVIKRLPVVNKKTFWRCKCDCGKVTRSRADSLLDGMIVSCGCYHSEWCRSLKGKRKTTGTLEQFEKRYIPEPMSGCWIWLAGFNPSNGYGRFYTGPNKCVYAHKFSFQTFKGSIPRGHMLRHTCDVKLCVNPDHIITGTAVDNAQDAVERGLYKIGKDHWAARLSESDVLFIFNSKTPNKQLALQFGVARAHISRIKTGGSWRHITCQP